MIGRLATEHLTSRGCRRIAHLRGPEIGIAAGRLAGYRRALEKHNLSVRPRYVIGGGARAFREETGYRDMRQLLEEDPIPDGVFCYNDPVAIGAIQATREAGLGVPRDICVVGAGNVHYSGQLAVPLTTSISALDKPESVPPELLLQQISAKRPLRPKTVLLSPRLVIRESRNRNPR